MVVSGIGLVGGAAAPWEGQSTPARVALWVGSHPCWGAHGLRPWPRLLAGGRGAAAAGSQPGTVVAEAGPQQRHVHGHAAPSAGGRQWGGRTMCGLAATAFGGLAAPAAGGLAAPARPAAGIPGIPEICGVRWIDSIRAKGVQHIPPCV